MHPHWWWCPTDFGMFYLELECSEVRHCLHQPKQHRRKIWSAKKMMWGILAARCACRATVGSTQHGMVECQDPEPTEPRHLCLYGWSRYLLQTCAVAHTWDAGQISLEEISWQCFAFVQNNSMGILTPLSKWFIIMDTSAIFIGVNLRIRDLLPSAQHIY